MGAAFCLAPFNRRENSIYETLAKSCQRFFHAANVTKIGAQPDDHARGLAHLLGVRARDGVVARKLELIRPGEGRPGLQRILGDIDEHRTRTTRTGDVERLGDRSRDLGRVGDQEVVLGDRHGDAADVRLLEGVGPDRRAGHLTGDRHHRH